MVRSASQGAMLWRFVRRIASYGGEKVVRGGCFAGYDRGPRKIPETKALAQQVHPFLRSAARYSVPPKTSSYAILGFRVVLGPVTAQHPTVSKQRPTSK